MTDLGRGVYVSHIDSDEFQPDPDDGGFVHILFEDGESMGGLWEPGTDIGSFPRISPLPRRETIVVLAGSARIEIEDGPTLDLKVGDMASMPAGAVLTWYPSADFKEVWIYS